MQTKGLFKLTLAVDNTSDLEGGVKATAVFGQEGGLIGTSPECDWVLKDRRKTVSPKHLRAFFNDGAFCLEAVSSTGVLVNDSARPVAKGEPFQVRDGDTLRIGRFTLRAYITETVSDSPADHTQRWVDKFTSVESLVDGQMSDLDGAGNVLDSVLQKTTRSISLQDRLDAQRKLDPLELMQEQGGATFDTKDPIAALDMEKNLAARALTSDLSDYLDAPPDDIRRNDIPDDFQPTTAYFEPPRVRGRSERPKAPPMSSQNTNDPYIAAMARGGGKRPNEAQNLNEVLLRDSWLGNAATSDNESEDMIDHVLLRPLCQGLGLPIQDMPVPEANRLVHEIGVALRVAVAGLIGLQQGELASRSLFAETQLHAIEDNPLRLTSDIDEAIKDLFLIQSPVHLSAGAAIGESLANMKHHQEASDLAIDAALSAVLKALAPIALAKRFLKYKGHAPRTGDLDAWHWRMYQHYYSELASHRQGGLSRMFREVFHQVYDREMRERTDEEQSSYE